LPRAYGPDLLDHEVEPTSLSTPGREKEEPKEQPCPRVTAQSIGRDGLGDRLIRMGEAMIAAHER
jgi:hypothetical protein